MDHEWARDIVESPDGGYYICGSTQSYGSGNFDIFLSKITENGDLIWLRTFGGSHFDYGEKLALTDDGHIYIAGSTSSYTNDLNPDHILIKTDMEGNQVWQKVLGSENSDYTGGLAVTEDQGVIFSGWTRKSIKGDTDIVVIRLNKDGEMDFISHLAPDNPMEENIKLFPNPSSGRLKIDLKECHSTSVHLHLTNLQGSKVLSVDLSSGMDHTIESGLATGVYLYAIYLDGIIRYSGKLIIQN
jgi:hypothetical protein